MGLAQTLCNPLRLGLALGSHCQGLGFCLLGLSFRLGLTAIFFGPFYVGDAARFVLFLLDQAGGFGLLALFLEGFLLRNAALRSGFRRHNLFFLGPALLVASLQIGNPACLSSLLFGDTGGLRGLARVLGGFGLSNAPSLRRALFLRDPLFFRDPALFRQQSSRSRLFQGFPASLRLGLGGHQHLGFLGLALGFPLGGGLLGRPLGFRREFLGDSVPSAAWSALALSRHRRYRDRRYDRYRKSNGGHCQQSRRLAHAMNSKC